jgi:hypothetical protein
MFQDLRVVDFHAHFPIKGDVSTSGVGVRQYAAGTPAAEQAAYMRAQSERYRAAWRLAWDFPSPIRNLVCVTPPTAAARLHCD